MSSVCVMLIFFGSLNASRADNIVAIYYPDLALFRYNRLIVRISSDRIVDLVMHLSCALLIIYVQTLKTSNSVNQQS